MCYDLRPTQAVNPHDAVCSCKQMGDCPIKDLSHDGSSTNALCTADELRGWLKRVISAQEMVYWKDRAWKAENAIEFARKTLEFWERPADAEVDE